MSTSPTNLEDALTVMLTSRFASARTTLRKLSALAVVRGITGKNAKIDFSKNEIEDCRAFVYVADAVRSELPIHAASNALYEIFDRVAEAFERFPTVLDREAESSRQLRSALNYVGAVKLSAAYTVTPSTLEESASGIRTELLTPFLQEAVHGLLRHEYRSLQQKYSRAGLRSLAMTIFNSPEPFSTVKAAIAVAVGKAVSGYATFSIDNNLEALEVARKEIKDASGLCRDIGDSSAISAVGEIRYLLDRFPTTYSRSVLQPWQSHLGEAYLSLLTRGQNSIHQLWPSQIDAVNQGLLNGRNTAVSMPTSAGKTLLAELKIAASLNRDPTVCVFYVVPLNALARQIQKQLQQRLRQQPLAYNVKVLTGAYEIEDADLATIKRENVVITTPEKLDALLRRSAENNAVKDQLDRCRLVVFDEFQNIGEGRRGITYEFLLSRIRQRMPMAELLCLSPLVSNVDQIAAWVGSDGKGISTDWRPTRLHYASWSSDGLTFDEGWNLSSYKRTPETKDDLGKIVMDLQSSFHSVLIMASTRKIAESYASQIWERVRTDPRYTLSGDDLGELSQLAAYVRSRTHAGSLLAKFIEMGIAYHHSHVPTEIRSRIEDLIVAKHLKIVVATTTLAEGVNLPVKCVVLPSIYFEATPMPALKLQNIFGRAARAGYTTEGQVIVFQNNEWVFSNEKFYKLYQYCFNPPGALLQVHSALAAASADGDSLDNINILQSLDSQILGMFMDRSAPEDNHSERITNTTFCVVDRPESVNQVQALVQSRIDKMLSAPRPLLVANSPLSLTSYGTQAARVGLGGDEIQLIVDEIERLWATVPDIHLSRDSGRHLRPQFLQSVLVPCFFMAQNLFTSIGIANKCKKVFGMPPSTARKHLGPVVQAIAQGKELHDAMVEAIIGVDIPAISAWLRGESPANFAQLFQSTAASTKIAKKQKGFEKALESSLMDSLHYFEHLMSSTSYSVFMVESVARMLAENSSRPMSEEVGNCYLYLQTGVGHPIAVFLLRETIMRDRHRAMEIAEHFDPQFPYTSKNCAHLIRTQEPLLRELLSGDEFESVNRATTVAGLQL